MNKTLLTLVFSIFLFTSWGQDKETKKSRNIGISYYGELGFRPGVEIDYQIAISSTQKDRKAPNKSIRTTLSFRPAFAYYFFNPSTNHFKFASKFNYQIQFINELNQRHFSIEPFVKVGYIRTTRLQGIYESTDQGYVKKSATEENSLALGSGIDLSGSISKQLDWLVGFDYFAEFTSDQLVLHRFVAKIGTRINL